MIRKLFVFVLLAGATCAADYAQTPEPGKEKAVKSFAFHFDGDGGYLGVQTEEVTKENFSKFGLREVRGVAIEKVMENSPAQQAGLQNGDVIVRFNGEEITSVRKLSRLISETAPDHQAKLTIIRNGDEREVTVTLAKRPTPKFDNGAFEFRVPMPPGKMDMPPMGEMPQMPAMPKGEFPRVFGPGSEGNVFIMRGGRQIGVGITPLTKQLADHFGVDGGVLINNVRENSPAAKAGLKAGDIIVEVDGKAVKSDFDLIRAIAEKKEGDVRLTIVRDRDRQTISVTPEQGKDGEFFYKFGGEDGLITPAPPLAPGKVTVARPATPTAAPAPMTLVRPAPRVL